MTTSKIRFSVPLANVASLTMTHNKTTSLAFVIVLLAVAVFCWGTKYKLSLYHSNRSKTTVAKVLSEAERPASIATLAKSALTSLYVVAVVGASFAIFRPTLFRPSWLVVRTVEIEHLLRILILSNGNSALRAPPLPTR